MTKTISRCVCGKRKRSDSHECNACHVSRMARLKAEAEAIVATNECPQCASKFRRNLALTGWWQCEQYGAPCFRARSNEPACSWQAFTR